MRGGWTKVGLSGAAIVALAIGIFVYGEADRASLADVPAVQAVPVIATKVQCADHLDRPRDGHGSEHGYDSQPDHRAARQRRLP
jgi:hypothetical protein